MRRLPDRLAAAAFLVAWVGVLTALQWSVVRFRLAIVLVLTSAAVLLTTALVRRWTPPPLPRPLLAAALLAGAVVTEVVPFFSHASPATVGCSPTSPPAPACSPPPRCSGWAGGPSRSRSVSPRSASWRGRRPRPWSRRTRPSTSG
ncbi:hypothetical protein GCM10025868_43480 [Angustibacter aerolatus]|uniref:Uncharacterized protein n=1 Tax=Angustibacter aerolatus TaxID=1162965 RepID=A0ABQ6JLI4_9ACTN|nr:hypothetical protein [Angustibacter aerolatus]GMA89098.1 hypothetical protein GCM10025868_43480 [Angustibacter aerolatus]